jgi:transcriptional regulator with XRE-family HTH domain
MDLKVFEITHFLKRNDFTFAELGEKLDCTPSLIGSWTSDRAFPSFDKCVKLLELGMTFEEMFGTELAEKTQVFTDEKEKQYEKESDFNKKVGEAVIALVNSGVSNLKKEG